LFILPIAIARSSSGGDAIDTLCTSGFVDDVRFSRNGPMGRSDEDRK